MSRARRGCRALQALLLPFLLVESACRRDMHDQPRFEPFEACDFFGDGRSARPQVPGTIARDDRGEEEYFTTGRAGGQFADAFPFPVTRDLLARGRERYDIHCAPCHARDGGGDGLIVKRGMMRPASFHEERLRGAPAGYFFDVMTRGFGAMFDVADRLTPDDRWAVTAYVRALQRSQSATLDDVPPDERARLASR